jgi:hypothetical protein
MQNEGVTTAPTYLMQFDICADHCHVAQPTQMQHTGHKVVHHPILLGKEVECNNSTSVTTPACRAQVIKPALHFHACYILLDNSQACCS